MKNTIQKNCFLTLALLATPLYIHAIEHNTVIATINTGVTPAGIAITPDSRHAYVANNNNYGIETYGGL